MRERENKAALARKTEVREVRGWGSLGGAGARDRGGRAAGYTEQRGEECGIQDGERCLTHHAGTVQLVLEHIAECSRPSRKWTRR